MKPAVLITGGSQGIGFATAELLLERGYRVVLLARGEQGLAAAASALAQAGHPAADIGVASIDMGNTAALTAVVPGLAMLQDGLFGLVNNAAVETLKPVVDYSLNEMEAMWRVNMLAPIMMIRLCHPFLKMAGGSIVNVSSISDRDHHQSYSVYGASKAFLNAFSRHAAKELGCDGIRINLVSPGAVDTPLLQSFIDNGFFSAEAIEHYKKLIPVEQRFSTPREVAETIYFALTGPRHLHGADLRLHGGAE